MLVRVLAAAGLLLVLWWAFRLAMGLRWSKIEREAAKRRELETGRRLVAEDRERPGAGGSQRQIDCVANTETHAEVVCPDDAHMEFISQ